MNTLIKLSKEEIESKYLNKPILIIHKDSKIWYIVSDVNDQMPLHMLTSEESDLYHLNEDNINGIKLAGVEGEDHYAMWIYFNEGDNGWQAYGYE
jgi:hypothetical protein